MATLEFSAGIMALLPQRVIGATPIGVTSINDGTTVSSLVPLIPQNLNVGGWGLTGFIAIMKGTVPTDFSTLTAYNSRSADVLATFFSTSGTNASQTTVFSQTSIVTTNPAIINSTYVAATASGTATWFRLISYQSQSFPIQHQAIGTIGLTGSGVDLELGDVNVVAGNQYRIANLKIQFPSSWTF